MARPRNSRNALAWQAAVILMPVIALAALGAFYLRQDRLLVRHEAEERARTLAQEIAEKLWRGLTNSAGVSEEYAFRIDEESALLFPLPYEKAPAPRPLDASRITPEQNALWQRNDAAALGRLLERQSELPADFQAVANYRYATALAAEKRVAEAYEVFRNTYQRSPRAVSEAGLPVALMAGLKVLESPGEVSSTKWARPLSWEILCGLAIAEPSALTSTIFERAARAGVLPAKRVSEHRKQWEAHETLRDLFRASRDHLSAPDATPIFWIRSGGERWLATRVKEPPANHWIVCRQIDSAAKAQTFRGTNSPSDGLRAMRVAVGSDIEPASLPELLRLTAIPNYLDLGLVAANEPIRFPPSTPVLATATHAENGQDLLKVSLHLAKPELLYSRQRQRVVWFGLLIAVSIVAALVGLSSAWRNFQKQERLAELKDNFVSSVSHELRAPIASVRLMAEGLERGRIQDPEKQHEYHHFIVQECQRLSALIQNVLDFSRIDQGRKQYEFESADVLRLVHETVKAMEPSASERQIMLRLPPPAESSLNAVVDARAIQQALINLIDNAIKHSPPGSEVIIEVSRRTTGAKQTLEISVEDHGEGIPKSEHERIFERFYRVGSELRRQTPGAGIGLSIVQHIVDAHGGGVRVESEPGKGSRFTIEIPFKG